MPPRSEAALRSWSEPSRSCHSVIIAITGCGVPRFSSVECAPASPQTLRAYSMTATCSPRQMPRYGTFFSRANFTAAILPSIPRSPKPPGTRIASTSFKHDVPSSLDLLGFHVEDIDARARPDAGVAQRLGERHVRIAQVDVLADHGDRHLGFRMSLGVDDGVPLREIGGPCVELQLVDDVAVEPLLGEQHRDLVDVVDVDGRDDGTLFDVREQRDLRALLARQRMLGAAHEHVGLDADRAQLLDGVLRRLGLDLRRRGHERHERQMNIERPIAAELDAHLPDRLEKRQRLDIAHGAADLDHADVGVTGRGQHVTLDLVGDVRDDLDGCAEILAAALFRDDVRVDLARREIAHAVRARVHEPLVVAQVEVGLRAVVGDVDLAVLERAHRARVDVDVRVELDEANLEAARLEDRAEAGRGNTFSERGHDPAGDEDESCHAKTGRAGRPSEGKRSSGRRSLSAWYIETVLQSTKRPSAPPAPARVRTGTDF